MGRQSGDRKIEVKPEQWNILETKGGEGSFGEEADSIKSCREDTD